MAHRTDVTKHAEHSFKVEHVGPMNNGQGGKPAKTRFRATCICGYQTKWRKFGTALHEDMTAHLAVAKPEEGMRT